MPRSSLFPAWLIASVTLAIYLSNEMIHPGDSPPNVYTALSMVEEGNVFITPKEAPFLFRWRLKTDRGTEEVAIQEMDDQISRWIDEGAIELIAPYFHVVDTRKPGVYISTFGPGTGVVGFPLIWLAHQIFGDLRERGDVLWWVGRLTGALCVVGSVVFLFLLIQEISGPTWAVFISLLYAFGTCIWTISAQGLWQHSPTELFLSAAIYAFARSRVSTEGAFWCGIAISVATWCRPTSVLYAIVFFLAYLTADWVKAWRFVVGALPLAVCLAAFNTSQLGAPWRFSQGEMAPLAVGKTGREGVFQTPIPVGAAGLLLSPSRGLLVYSPMLAAGLIGVVLILARGALPVLRPAALAMLAIWMIEFMHFDWWGGWSFGYRHLVDSAFLLSATSVVVLPILWKPPLTRAAFLLAAGWSVAVQMLAVSSYDIGSWNARRAFESTNAQGVTQTYWSREEAEKAGGAVREVNLDIDMPVHRSRLWSWSDNPLGYLMTHAQESREERRRRNEVFLIPKSVKLIRFHEHLARRWEELGDHHRAEEARRQLELARAKTPG